jgi:hypothetical protein
LDGFKAELKGLKQTAAARNKVKNTDKILLALENYGFIFTGLTNGKVTSRTTEFTIEYPDNNNIIVVLMLVAQKAASVDANDLFCKWSFRLVSEGLGANSYDDPFYAIHDKTRTDEEQKFISDFHQIMKEKGCFYSDGSWNEGPGICYYDKEMVMKHRGPYLYRILDWMGDLRLMLRIRNAEKCIDLYNEQSVPQEITEMFRHSDPGCGAHANGSCKKGVGYNFEGQPRWHCGCCSAPFWLHPNSGNIIHYIKLVEAGERR